MKNKNHLLWFISSAFLFASCPGALAVMSFKGQNWIKKLLLAIFTTVKLTWGWSSWCSLRNSFLICFTRSCTEREQLPPESIILLRCNHNLEEQDNLIWLPLWCGRYAWPQCYEKRSTSVQEYFRVIQRHTCVSRLFEILLNGIWTIFNNFRSCTMMTTAVFAVFMLLLFMGFHGFGGYIPYNQNESWNLSYYSVVLGT